jgi:hypothetical protein
MSITTIARQAQGIRTGEVITKLAEDAYFMLVDNRVSQVPPPSELMKPETTKPLVVARQTWRQPCPRRTPAKSQLL